jgi:hypothetical protein
MGQLQALFYLLNPLQLLLVLHKLLPLPQAIAAEIPGMSQVQQVGVFPLAQAAHGPATFTHPLQWGLGQ